MTSETILEKVKSYIEANTICIEDMEEYLPPEKQLMAKAQYDAFMEVKEYISKLEETAQ